MSASTRTAVRRLQAQDLPTPAVWEAAMLPAQDQLVAGIISDHEGLGYRTAPAVSPRRPAARPARRRTRVTIVASAVAVVTVLAIVIIPGLLGTSATANAVTPGLLSYAAPASPDSAAMVLTRLAATARKQGPAPGTGKYSYTKIQSWDLSTNQDVDGNTISAAVVPTVRETWAAPDGSGLEMRSNPDRPGSTSQVLAPGTPVVYQDLPTDPVALKQVLAQTHPARGTYEWFVAVTDVWGVGRPVPPAVQSGLLVLLAGQPDITVLGHTVDRAGRSGIAVSTQTTAPGYRQQNILIFDTTTGALLSAEEVALSKGSALPVTPPATVGYTMWLAAGHVTTVGSRP